MDIRLIYLFGGEGGVDLGYEGLEWGQYPLVKHFCTYFVSTVNAKVPVY